MDGNISLKWNSGLNHKWPSVTRISWAAPPLPPPCNIHILNVPLIPGDQRHPHPRKEHFVSKEGDFKGAMTHTSNSNVNCYCTSILKICKYKHIKIKQGISYTNSYALRSTCFTNRLLQELQNIICIVTTFKDVNTMYEDTIFLI